jgi:hypothetical protein
MSTALPVLLILLVGIAMAIVFSCIDFLLSSGGILWH